MKVAVNDSPCTKHKLVPKLMIMAIVASLSLVAVLSPSDSRPYGIVNMLTRSRRSEMKPCAQMLQQRVAPLANDASLTDLMQVVPVAQSAKILSVSGDGQVVEKSGEDVRREEWRFGDLASKVKQSHKFVSVDKSYLFLYPDNMVIHVDGDSCAIHTVYMPTTSGRFHPKIEAVAVRHVPVAQDKGKKKPKPTRRPTKRPTPRPTPPPTENLAAKECGIPISADEGDVRHATSADAHFDDGDVESTETYHFPDMVHPGEHHEEIFGKFRSLKADKDGFYSRNVRVTGANGRYLNVNFRGRYKDRTHFLNLETEEDLVRFGCTKEGLVLEFGDVAHVERIKARLDGAAKSKSVDHVMVTGKQLLRCPKSTEPDYILKHHEFGDKVRPSETRMTQSVRRVVGSKMVRRDGRVWLHVDTSYANLLDVFSDLEFSGGTDMVERDSELRRRKFRHAEPNENGILDVHRDAYESLKKEMVYPRVRLTSPLVQEKEGKKSQNFLKEDEKRRRMFTWLKKAFNWVVDKIVKPVVNFVIDAVKAVKNFVESVVGTIIQPVLAFLGRLIPELLNKKGTEPIGKAGSTLASLNYDASTGHAKRIWEIDGKGIQTGGIVQLGAKTSGVILAAGKVVCRDCFVRFYDGSFSWHVIIGGEKLGLLELKSKIHMEFSIELDATISLVTQVSQAFEGIPIPFLSVELGIVTLGFSLEPEFSIGIQWDANGFYYKYHARGWQEFGVRASLLGGVEAIRDGHIDETSVGPLIKEDVKASLYVIPLVALVFTDVMAVEAGVQPTISFLLKPSNVASKTCALDYSIQFDCPIVVGAWIGLKTSFGMWRLAGFSQAFSVLPTIAIKDGCLTSDTKREIEKVSGWAFSTTDQDNAKQKATQKRGEYSTQTNKFKNARCKVMKDHLMEKSFPSEQEKWVMARGRNCADACKRDAGNKYSEYKVGRLDFSVCSANYANQGWRTGFVDGSKCFVPYNGGHKLFGGSEYKCMCIQDKSKYSLEAVKNGANCGVVCESARKQPVVSGAWKKSQIYYICGAKYPTASKWRPGFNAGGHPSDPNFGKNCIIGSGTSYSAQTKFSCLCRTPTIKLRPPLQWVERTGTNCAETCDRLAQYPVTTAAEKKGGTTENYLVCRRRRTSTEFFSGYSVVKSNGEYTACETWGPSNAGRKVSCLCTTSVERYVEWFERAGFRNCKETCEYHKKHPIYVEPDTSNNFYVCKGRKDNKSPYQGGENNDYKICKVGQFGTYEQYKCGCSDADWQTFSKWK